MPSRLRGTVAGIVGCLVAATLLWVSAAGAAPIAFVDDAGRQIRLDAPPQRVVSLVPAVTEIIFAMGAGDAVQAVTGHDTWPPQASLRPVVGGYFAPDVQRVAAAAPQVIFVAALQQDVLAHFATGAGQLIDLEIDSIAGSFATIRRLGQIFDRAEAAEALVAGIQSELALVAAKVAKIPAARRLRVMRFMGRDQVMTPGDDSFQNEMIRAAGGIPPHLGKTGAVVAVTLDEWRRFNPQVVYGCGGDRAAAARLFHRPGWQEVDAVANGRVIYFPCELTCRCAAHTGYFAGWLASRLYPDEFGRQADQVHPDGRLTAHPLKLDLAYVADIRVADSRIHDFVNKSLIVDFNAPMTVVSTLEGPREGILTVGNHYAPPPCWAIDHAEGIAALRRRVYRVLGQPAETTAFLFTGADMDHLSVQQRSYQAMAVHALVTAGVESNAQRMSQDVGNWYEPGTINIILLTNMRLSPRAMTRALITATEAKTAALLDLDVRSSYRPRLAATGTGTDNIIVVQGTGTPIDNAGGHSKMGELIAAAVHAGVLEALFRQNGLTAQRSVFRRLAERRIDLWALAGNAPCDCGTRRGAMVAAVEKVLMDDRYGGFLEAAMALADAEAAGRVKDLSHFASWCRQVAEAIAGRPVARSAGFVTDDQVPTALKMALDAVFTGAGQRVQRQGKQS